jgi:hypothetical protein
MYNINMNTMEKMVLKAREVIEKKNQHSILLAALTISSNCRQDYAPHTKFFFGFSGMENR